MKRIVLIAVLLLVLFCIGMLVAPQKKDLSVPEEEENTEQLDYLRYEFYTEGRRMVYTEAPYGMREVSAQFEGESLIREDDPTFLEIQKLLYGLKPIWTREEAESFVCELSEALARRGICKDYICSSMVKFKDNGWNFFFTQKNPEFNEKNLSGGGFTLSIDGSTMELNQLRWDTSPWGYPDTPGLEKISYPFINGNVIHYYYYSERPKENTRSEEIRPFTPAQFLSIQKLVESADPIHSQEEMEAFAGNLPYLVRLGDNAVGHDLWAVAWFESTNEWLFAYYPIEPGGNSWKTKELYPAELGFSFLIDGDNMEVLDCWWNESKAIW